MASFARRFVAHLCLPGPKRKVSDFQNPIRPRGFSMSLNIGRVFGGVVHAVEAEALKLGTELGDELRDVALKVASGVARLEGKTNRPTPAPSAKTAQNLAAALDAFVYGGKS